jgi:phospholipid transport system substrate-binding protein
MPVITISYRPFLILILGLCSIFANAAAEENRSPAQIVERLQGGILAIDAEFAAAAHDTANYDRRVLALTPLIETTHDLAVMARMTIKNHWNALDDDQRKQFVSAFGALSVATYASRFRDLANVRFRTVNERHMPHGRVEIQTELIEDNADIVALNYVLHETDGGWRIINVLADGVSELALKRTQYQQILKSRDFAMLVQHIEQQRADLAQEEPTGSR